MRRITYRRPVGNSPRTWRVTNLALVAALLFTGYAQGSTRPQTGGTLRIQMSQRVTTLDPRQWPADSVQSAAVEKLASLVFDHLTRFDDHGLVQPALAISWENDATSKRWQFRLRTGLTFADGSPLTPVEAALALQQLLGNIFDVSATSDSVVIQSDHEIKGLPARLAGGRYFIFHPSADGSLSGTGPFRIAEWPSAEAVGKNGSPKVILVANETYWAGRPFVDRLEITMGVSPQQQANAIAFGEADVVELSAGQVRAAMQRGVRTQSSDPVDLLALQFDLSWPAVQDPLVRGAIAHAMDRAPIADAILQKQAMPAGGLLPNWISGYAHLFSTAADPSLAMKTLSNSQHKVSRTAPLTLVYDSGDADARAVSERVAVNLREVGIIVNAIGASGANIGSTPAEMRLLRIHIAAPDAAIALAGVLTSLGESAGDLETPEQMFAAERAPIEVFRVIPLVHVSENVGLGSQVRDWMPPRWGGWRLDDVWLAPAVARGVTAP
jgi:peptide/nickel transport system substrate-binding protein